MEALTSKKLAQILFFLLKTTPLIDYRMKQNNVNNLQFGKTYAMDKSLLGKLSFWTTVPLHNHPLSLGQSSLGPP